MPAANDFTEVTVLCLGTRLLNGTKKCTAVQLVDEHEEPVGEPCLYLNLKGTHPGGIFTCKATLEGNELQTIKSNLKFAKQMSDREWAAEIRLSHDAAETTLAALSQVKKAKNDKTPLLEVLRPLRRAYQKTNANGKLAIEVRVLNYLRNGRDL